MAGAFRGGGRGGGGRKDRSWARVGFGGSQVPAGGTAIIDMLSDYEVAVGRTVGDVTVGRIIGRLGLCNTGVQAVASRLAIGIIIVTDQAFTAGATSMPDPDDAALAADWLWIDEFMVPRAASIDPPWYYNVAFDVRGMRKMDGFNKKLALITSLMPVTDRLIVSYWFAARILLLGTP